MCTVTFIPTKEGVFITSNRDEKKARPSSLHPAIYTHDSYSLIYPKDGAKGGSWIAVAENGNAGVLLNGAFKNHVPLPTYIKSRGIIFTKLLSDSNPKTQFSTIDLAQVEPFTIILFIQKKLFVCRWDGQTKSEQQLDSQKPAIWSSATLYNPQVINKREKWFFAWLKENPQPAVKDILHFHKFTGDGDYRNSLQMNRDNQLLTQSITCVFLSAMEAKMKYIDLLSNRESDIVMSFSANNQVHEV